MKKVFLRTFGCQANFYDSARIKDLFLAGGYEITENLHEADVFVLNTCHVREKSGEKVFSELGRVQDIKKTKISKGQRMVIVVTGCVAKVEGGNIFRRIPMVDVVLDTENYHRICQFVNEIFASGEDGKNDKLLFVDNFPKDKKFALLPPHRTVTDVSEMVIVQDGCDKFCSYCSVPFSRGREYSRPVESVLEEINYLVDQGVKEITLLGQNVDNYNGSDRTGRSTPLSELLYKVNNIGAIERIRYLTSYPSQFGNNMVKAHQSLPKLMPLVYLPVQSGSNSILRAMNRNYGREQYLDLIRKIRDNVRGIAFSSDFIVGFPGETDSDFEDTLELVEKIGYALTFSFKYSLRPNTAAARMPNQIPEDTKAARLEKLQALLNRQQLDFNSSSVGKIVDVLVENSLLNSEKNMFFGRTPHYQPVLFSTSGLKVKAGSIVAVKIETANLRTLRGKLIHDQ
ncbi:MAG: tRNA (N6-isopentenyl adenosine(37)-C2)-methylthiotransferase MiaB [Rickettsiales bacterium]|jgi:tRNA-2-methylthio-N6-dimethylallyladenosine synthase|nr:tRNA (N6-isopentenyl adenosine(37)-C2)-methylthiotransferase MiaB [Rickettsiales bacterium]